VDDLPEQTDCMPGKFINHTEGLKEADENTARATASVDGKGDTILELLAYKNV